MNLKTNILSEKCAKYIWLYNQRIKQIKTINCFFIYQLIFFSYINTFMMCVLDLGVTSQKILSLGYIYICLLLTLYFYKDISSEYEKNKLARYRYVCFLNKTFGFKNLNDYEILQEYAELKRIQDQSPQVPYNILTKFNITFVHILQYKPHLKMSLLEKNPKAYHHTFQHIMFLTKYFNIWKTYYNNSYKRQQFRQISSLGYFYNTKRSCGEIFPFKNIKLNKNNIEFNIV